MTVAWLEKNPNVLIALVKGYDTPDIALPSGAMLRECLRYENLAKIVLLSPTFYNFFKYVEVSNFDSASDAFNSLKVRLLIGILLGVSAGSSELRAISSSLHDYLRLCLQRVCIHSTLTTTFFTRSCSRSTRRSAQSSLRLTTTRSSRCTLSC